MKTKSDLELRILILEAEKKVLQETIISMGEKVTYVPLVPPQPIYINPFDVTNPTYPHHHWTSDNTGVRACDNSIGVARQS